MATMQNQNNEMRNQLVVNDLTQTETETILLLGGHDGTNELDSLLILENNRESWKELNVKLPYPVQTHGAQFLNNNLYIFGGYNNADKYLNWTYKLSKSLQWEKVADMNKARCYISYSSVVLNNQIWVCGGMDEKRDPLKSVEMYDPETKTWKYMKEMNERRLHAAAAVVNGKIFISGGWYGKSLDSIECYDPSSDAWTLICNMPQEIWGHGAVEIDGNLIVMGGYSGGHLKNVWALDTTDKNAVWIEKPSMSIPRNDFSIAKIDDKVFVCGGETRENNKWKYLDDVEIFDGEVWSNGPKMPTPRRAAPAAVIPMEFARSLK